MPLMTTRQVALTAVMTAASVVVASSKEMTTPFLPGAFEFMTVLIFVSGFSFGWVVGASIGIVTLTVYMLVPYPFAHPAAWLFSISPILLAVMAILGGMFGAAGAVASRLLKPQKRSRFVVALALLGFGLTFTYDIVSSVGFALAYPVYSTVWQAIVLTFIPAYLPYPPIIHTVTNTIIFATIAPALIISISKLPNVANPPTNKMNKAKENQATQISQKD